MEISNIESTVLRIPVEIPRLEEPLVKHFVFTEVETDDGVSGYGLSGIAFQRKACELVSDTIAPLLRGENPLAPERLSSVIREGTEPGVHEGVMKTGISTVDIALWDIKGKHLGEPVWRLLGGSEGRIRTVTTFGIGDHSKSDLVELASEVVSRGETRLKMQVGRQDAPDPVDDAARIEAVSDAVGNEVELVIDAKKNYSVSEAVQLCNLVGDRNIAWFEEPVHGNDETLLLNLQRRTSVPIAAGQQESTLQRHRELIASGAIDIAQPNVCFGGGFSECREVASLAKSFNLPIANGAGYTHHNMHLIGGVDNGWRVEVNPLSGNAVDMLYRDLPQPVDGELTLGDEAGLGMEPDVDVIERYRADR